MIPGELRARHRWEAGTELIVEERGDALVLRPVKPFAPTRVEDGLGCTGYRGPAQSVEEMRAAHRHGAEAALARGPGCMIAVDTNVLVRHATNDDPGQARRAAHLLAGAETVYVPHTVLLEMELVLRAAYELARPAILIAFRQVLGLPSVRVDQPGRIALTLERYERGFDFADALHLAGAAATPLYTLDRRFARLAADDGVVLL